MGDEPVLDPYELGKAQTAARHAERSAIRKALPELRDAHYAEVLLHHENRVVWQMHFENERRIFEYHDGDELAEIRFLLTTGEDVGSGMWTRYLTYCGLPERTARHRIQVAEGRYSKPVAAIVAAGSLPEPDMREIVEKARRYEEERAFERAAPEIVKRPRLNIVEEMHRRNISKLPAELVSEWYAAAARQAGNVLSFQSEDHFQAALRQEPRERVVRTLEEAEQNSETVTAAIRSQLARLASGRTAPEQTVDADALDTRATHSPNEEV
ncbi:MAG TPA: hypothetical protein VF916_12205 [Ktedonobacterales bacterium]